MTAIATIGPGDYPTRVEVTVTGRATVPDFYAVTAGDGTAYTVHRLKLRPVPPAQSQTADQPTH